MARPVRFSNEAHGLAFPGAMDGPVAPFCARCPRRAGIGAIHHPLTASHKGHCVLVLSLSKHHHSPMSIYTAFDCAWDGRPILQVASNFGWGRFGDWVETLKGFPGIAKLWEIGECEDVPGLRAEMEKAIQESSPTDANTLDVAHQVIRNIDAAGESYIMLITNGIINDPHASGQPEPGVPSAKKPPKRKKRG
jgi:hypothetical protein